MMSTTTPKPTDKDAEIVESINEYLDAFAEGDYEAAGEAVAGLMEMDCSVCQGFGQHLTAFVVAAETATRDEARRDIELSALREAKHIRDEVILG